MKKAAKKTIVFLSIILILPLFVLHLMARLFTKNGAFLFCNHLLSLVPGLVGSYVRRAFFSLTMTHCSSDSQIGFMTLFSQIDTEIAEGVYIGPQCNIGMCKIGKDTLIASGVHILSGSQQHNFDDLSKPIQQQGGHYSKITIGEDSWVGNGSLIMANIGNKCIIGAGSVVIRDIPDYSIAVGNPAKIIKSRLDSTLPDST